MKNKKFFIAVLIILSMVVVLMTGCSSSNPAEETEVSENTTQTEDTEEDASVAETSDNSESAEEENNKEEETTSTETEENDSNADAEAAESSDKTNESSDDSEPAKTQDTQDTSENTEAEAKDDAEADAQDNDSQKEPEEERYKGALSEAIAEQPVLLTSSGQSADVQMVKVLLERAGVKYTINPVVKAEEIKDVKTLVVAIGGSSKGLGAAGIDAEEELERTKSIIAKAEELGLKIIALHIGGEARRGELSDKFINVCVPKADYVIVVEEGDKDGLFTKLTSENNIPMDKVQKITEVVDPLKSAFK